MAYYTEKYFFTTKNNYFFDFTSKKDYHGNAIFNTNFFEWI